MPYKPKKPCAYQGCPQLTDSRYCEEHQKLMNKQYEQYGRQYKPSVRYGTAWKKVRKRYAAEHPFCEECFKQGKLTPTEHVHHITPLEEGGTHDSNNLMALCKSCHSRIHSERGDRWNGKPHEYKINS